MVVRPGSKQDQRGLLYVSIGSLTHFLYQLLNGELTNRESDVKGCRFRLAIPSLPYHENLIKLIDEELNFQFVFSSFLGKQEMKNKLV